MEDLVQHPVEPSFSHAPIQAVSDECGIHTYLTTLQPKHAAAQPCTDQEAIKVPAEQPGYQKADGLTVTN